MEKWLWEFAMGLLSVGYYLLMLGFCAFVIIAALRSGEIKYFLTGKVDMPWEKEDKKRAEAEAKARAEKKWWEA